MKLRKIIALVAVLVGGMVATFPVLAEEMTVNLGGRIQIDAALYDEDIEPLDSGSEVRRARFFISGDIADGWSYKAQYDLASSSDIKDLYIRYSGDIGKITIGQSKVPFGLEELTSSKYVTFMERALPIEAFAPSRRLGVNWSRQKDAVYLQAMVFGKEANTKINGDQGVGVAGRVAWTPVKTDDSLIHVGIAAVWKEPDSGDDLSVRYRARPESHVTSTRFVSSTVNDVNSSTLYDLEFAGVRGGLSLQGEYINASVDTDTVGVSNPDFNGYYGYASWFPGGESRPYKNGAFGRVKANGAWELALRYSSLDLNDGTFTGGKEKNLTLGVNYYVNPYLRVMANYVMADIEGGINGNEDPNALTLRIAMDFK